MKSESNRRILHHPSQTKVEYLMSYTAYHIQIPFHAIKMILHVASDAAYLVLPKAQSQMIGYYYLANKHHPT